MTTKGTIDTIAFGGSGILRQDGHVIFIPFTAPEEIVEAKITEEKKQFAKGQLLRIIESSPYRTKSACDHFGTCGGCQLQHIQYDKQLEIKKQFVYDALFRIGKLSEIPSFAIKEASKPYHYRNHITLQIANKCFGYASHWDNSWIPIHHCPIFDAQEKFFREDLVPFLRRIKPPDTHLKIIKASPDQYVFSFYAPLPKLDKSLLADFPFCQGIQAKGKLLLGSTNIRCTMLGLQVEYAPDFFMQNYLEQAQNLYQHILSLTSSQGHALDLYCGIGITSLLLSQKGHKTTGIEISSQAIKHAKKLHTLNPHISSPDFVQADATSFTKAYQDSPDLVLVNPPKTGLSPQLIEVLLSKKPRQIIYTSCMPSTLARDLARLTCAYRIASIQCFDMFPQTTHLETVVSLEKID